MEGTIELIKILIIVAIGVGIKYFERRRKAQLEAAKKQKQQTVITTVNKKENLPELSSEDPYDFQNNVEMTSEEGSEVDVFDRPAVMNYENTGEVREANHRKYSNSEPGILYSAMSINTQNNRHYKADTHINNVNVIESSNVRRAENSMDINIYEVDWRKALIYSEILKPKF